MAKAAKTRVNISFKDESQGGKQVELPEKILVLGDFGGKKDGEDIEDKVVEKINAKSDLNKIMKKMDVRIKTSVKDTLREDNDEIPVDLKIESIADFSPDNVIEQVPDLKKLLDLRKALKEFKIDLNSKDFKKRIHQLISNPEERQSILDSIIDEKEE